MPWAGEVLSGITPTRPALIFSTGNAQDPMHLVLDPPAAAGRTSRLRHEVRRISGQTAELIPVLFSYFWANLVV